MFWDEYRQALKPLVLTIWRLPILVWFLFMTVSPRLLDGLTIARPHCNALGQSIAKLLSSKIEKLRSCKHKSHALWTFGPTRWWDLSIKVQTVMILGQYTFISVVRFTSFVSSQMSNSSNEILSIFCWWQSAGKKIKVCLFENHAFCLLRCFLCSILLKIFRFHRVFQRNDAFFYMGTNRNLIRFVSRVFCYPSRTKYWDCSEIWQSVSYLFKRCPKLQKIPSFCVI